MKEILSAQVEQAVCALFAKACICPPEDVCVAVKAARDAESSALGREVLDRLVENNEIAAAENVPSCQDTGMAVVFLDIGQDVHISGDLEAAVNRGVARAYKENFFRKSVLSPLGRVNTGDNTPAVIHTRIVPGDELRIIAAPKGFGSENMSKIVMLKPSMGIEGVKRFIIESARAADANPCPPVILGVGIGGTFEKAALMAKRELLRPMGENNPDPELAALEDEVKDAINALGIGPMGLGGDCYCLAVNIAAYPTHLAGLPVAVNYCCHALRHAETVL